MTINRRYLALLLLLPVLAACTPYRSREVPFKPPTAFANMQSVGGAQVASQAYADPVVAKKAFGFDIRAAGLLPVQVIIDNRGTQGLTIVPGQTFLIDANGNYWNLLDSRTAYERVEKSSEFATIAKGAGKGSVLGVAGGAIVGAAIGILSGRNFAENLGKGAAVGAAGGALIGGANAGSNEEASRQISHDLATKALENRSIPPGSLGRGFLFFPGEAPSASRLRLQLQDESGKRFTLLFNLL